MNIVVIGSEKSGKTTLASKLGKKGTDSDITLYNFVKENHQYAFIDAKEYPQTIKPFMEAINLAETALLCVPPGALTPQTGECIIGLDLLGMKNGIFVLTMSDKSNPTATEALSAQLKNITKGTSLEKWEHIAVSTQTFESIEELKGKLSKLEEIAAKETEAKNLLPPRVFLDHSFNVTGIGCVALGVVKQGTINVHNQLNIFPINRSVEIRSIQSNDIDRKSASAGCRVGVALKGIQAKEIDRGYVVSQKEEISSRFELRCKLTKFTGGMNVGGHVHLFVGLQSSPAKIEAIKIGDNDVATAPPGSECTAVISSEKEFAFSLQDKFLVAQLTNPKQRFVASGSIITS